MATKYFRIGKKQVFLPDQTIAFIRPRENQPPNFATFRVPLTFNKLDFRDYLLHAYNVPVLGVRSQLTQRRPRQSKMHHRIYRPPPVKTMTVELHQPFVWPEPPEDKSPWNPPMLEKRYQHKEMQEKWQKEAQKTGKFPLRDEQPKMESSLALREEAKRLLKDGNWENHRNLDPKFTEKK
ncbi:uncharacterized protein F4812DRAFT_276301 [Daldinia caldariorum]|uniref:uncharacterized protein n=1 Tax=Daldinia caldariorum TaxID=326644 RepID=UPI002007EDB7|nr:uncharacterized protein F4812DRAFT_276301 [Daldinia caldariorum]KAI1470726.1 hypothetical protein F4812DRAFT_276301 [Daldinia caldariorum]